MELPKGDSSWLCDISLAVRWHSSPHGTVEFGRGVQLELFRWTFSFNSERNWKVYITIIVQTIVPSSRLFLDWLTKKKKLTHLTKIGRDRGILKKQCTHRQTESRLLVWDSLTKTANVAMGRTDELLLLLDTKEDLTSIKSWPEDRDRVLNADWLRWIRNRERATEERPAD